MSCPHTPWSMLCDLRAADPEHFTNEQRWLFAELYGAQRFWTEQERARVVGAWMAMKGTP